MRKRNTGINIRVTEKEKEKIENNAGICSLSISEYLRQLAIGHEPRELPKEKIYDLMIELEREIEELQSFIAADLAPDKLISFTESTRSIRKTISMIWKLLLTNFRNDRKGSDTNGDD